MTTIANDIPFSKRVETLWESFPRIGVSEDKKPDTFEIIINGISEGVIYYLKNQWVSFTIEDKSLVEIIGTCIYKLYKKGNSMFKKLIPAKFAFN